MASDAKRCHVEVEKALRAIKGQIDPQKSSDYHGGGMSKLEFLGLKVPQIAKAYKDGFSFSDRDDDELFEIWSHVWQESETYEAMSLALCYAGSKKARDQILPRWTKLKGWVKRVDNWPHSDGLSSLYAHGLEREPKKILPTLESWSESKNPWERRQSIVSLIYYAAAREKFLPFPTLKKLVEAQLDFDHHYVQKGVGWTLREMGNVYPRETLRFLSERAETLSAAAFSAATEKLEWKDKERLKAARKKARKR